MMYFCHRITLQQFKPIIMKNLFFVFFFSIVALSLNAQEEPNNKKQARIVIKTAPLPMIASNYKLGIDIAIDHKSTIEFQTGFVRTERFLSTKYTPHVLLRYKRDIIEDEVNLSGLYYAIGLDVGQWNRNGNHVYLYGIAFTDIGFQFAIKAVNFDLFTGIGLLTTEGNYSEPEAGCVGCGLDLEPNSISHKSIAVRLGARVGYQF